MLRNKKIIIIMPAYNAEKTLAATFEAIPKGVADEIILVDDASKDKTVNLAKSLGLKVVVHPKNLGYGGNQKTCYREALKLNADIVVMLHPDFQYDPTCIPPLIQPILDGQCDAVIGSRMIIRSNARKGGMPYWKFVANIALTKLENWILRKNLSEYHSGFRAYSRRVLQLPIELNSDNFVFDTEVLVQMTLAGLRVGDVPIPTRYFPEASQIGFVKSVEYGLSILNVLRKYLLHKSKLRTYRQFVV